MARGNRSTIRLDSPSLVWTSSSTGVTNTARLAGCSSSGKPSLPEDNSSCLGAAGPFVRVDGERMEAVGFSDVIRLSAASSFDLAVAGGGGEEESGMDGGQAEEEGAGKQQGGGEEDGRRSRMPWSGSGAGPTASALLRGDSGSLNATAGVVMVEVQRKTA